VEFPTVSLGESVMKPTTVCFNQVCCVICMVSWYVLGRWYAYMWEDRTHMTTFDFDLNEVKCGGAGCLHLQVLISSPP
jgi:hypothetical protein